MDNLILIKSAFTNSLVLFLFRVSSLLLSILLINNLNIKDFAFFQLIKNIIGYLLICMEFGFFHYGNKLYNKDLFKFSSIFFNFLKLRFIIFLFFYPIIFFYFYINNFDDELLKISFLICFILILSYEGALVIISKNLELNLILLSKTLFFFILLFIYRDELNIVNVLYFFIYSLLFGIFLQYFLYLTFKDNNTKFFKKNFFYYVIKSKNYFLINITNHFSLYIGLTISPFIISTKQIANYAILLLVLEILMIPLFQLQKILMPNYAKNKNNKSLIYSLKLFFIILIIGVILHYLIGDFLFEKLLTSEYSKEKIIDYVYVLFPLAFLRGINTLINLYFYYNNLIIFQRNISILNTAVSFFIFLYLGHEFKIIGLIFALFFVELFYLILSYKFSKKIF